MTLLVLVAFTPSVSFPTPDALLHTLTPKIVTETATHTLFLKLDHDDTREFVSATEVYEDRRQCMSILRLSFSYHPNFRGGKRITLRYSYIATRCVHAGSCAEDVRL